MKAFKYIISIAALTAALTLSAKASFIADTNPGGAKGFIDVANHDVNSFNIFVGANNSSAPHVGVTTMGNVDTGSGWSNIAPHGLGTLTDLIFTPANDTLFNDFSMRGMLVSPTTSLTIIVTDSLGNVFTIPFTGLQHDPHDFARLGVVSLDGETIKSVEVQGSFKEVKQIEFSFAPGTVPDGGATVMLLGGALGALGMTRRFLKKLN
jgi:hypothetical protein